MSHIAYLAFVSASLIIILGVPAAIAVHDWRSTRRYNTWYATLEGEELQRENEARERWRTHCYTFAGILP